MKIKNINDLKKEMMLAKKRKDKETADTLMMLLDYTQKIAKEKNEEPNIEHLKQAVKKYLKIIEDAEKSGIKSNEKEIILKIKKEIFPPEFTETELTHIIMEFFNDNPDAKPGQVLGWLRKQFGDRVNMKLASQLANKLKG